MSVCLFIVYLTSVHINFMPDTRNTYIHTTATEYELEASVGQRKKTEWNA